jgi:hypothetical protein
MNQVRAYAMTDNLASLKAGLTGFRNAVDWTDKMREEAISYANAIFDGRIEDEGQEEGGREISNDGVALQASGTDEDDEDEDEDGDDEDEGGDEDDELTSPAAPRQIFPSFMSTTSQKSTLYDSSHPGDAAQQDSETSPDELALYVPPPTKRRSGSQKSPDKPKRQAKAPGRRRRSSSFIYKPTD